MEQHRTGTAMQNKSTLDLSVYDHAHLEGKRRLLRWVITNIGFRFLTRLERVEGLENIPKTGPAIIVYNHIATLDSGMIMGILPRNVIPMAKIEAYNLPVMGGLIKMWEVIPVRRGSVDRSAIKLSLAVLAAGEVLLISPEGTRYAAMQKAKDGVAYLATRTNVPIVPAAISGTEGYPSVNPARWAQGGACIKFGRPFFFRKNKGRPRKKLLSQMTEEMMYYLASLLPQHLRGYYSNYADQKLDLLDFPALNNSARSVSTI